MTEQSPSTAAQKPQEQARSPAAGDRSWGSQLDSIARERFDRQDWIELAATVLLSLATIVAAWSAYQSTRWGGVQAASFSAAGAKRTEATQYSGQAAAQLQIDVMSWVTYLEQWQKGDDEGTRFLQQRFREEFRPAFSAWLAAAPEGGLASGTPFELPEYRPRARELADALNAEAESLTDRGREANQVSDNFVLVAVVMASVLFFAGVGNKLKGHRVRLLMLTMGVVLFLAGTTFMLSLPQDFGI